MLATFALNELIKIVTVTTVTCNPFANMSSTVPGLEDILPPGMYCAYQGIRNTSL